MWVAPRRALFDLYGLDRTSERARRAALAVEQQRTQQNVRSRRSLD